MEGKSSPDKTDAADQSKEKAAAGQRRSLLSRTDGNGTSADLVTHGNGTSVDTATQANGTSADLGSSDTTEKSLLDPLRAMMGGSNVQTQLGQAYIAFQGMLILNAIFLIIGQFWENTMAEQRDERNSLINMLRNCYNLSKYMRKFTALIAFILAIALSFTLWGTKPGTDLSLGSGVFRECALAAIGNG
jgi:hypothetical protein